jgi:hypothetical protein
LRRSLSPDSDRADRTGLAGAALHSSDIDAAAPIAPWSSCGKSLVGSTSSDLSSRIDYPNMVEQALSIFDYLDHESRAYLPCVVQLIQINAKTEKSMRGENSS